MKGEGVAEGKEDCREQQRECGIRQEGEQGNGVKGEGVAEGN